jgi:hypothetical protein
MNFKWRFCGRFAAGNAGLVRKCAAGKTRMMGNLIIILISYQLSIINDHPHHIWGVARFQTGKSLAAHNGRQSAALAALLSAKKRDGRTEKPM